MDLGTQRYIDELGRIVIPKQYLEFYKIGRKEEVYLISTPEGILITNAKYKVVKIEDEAENN